MQAGDLNKQITFFREATSLDKCNSPINHEVELWTVWANVKPLTGRELISAQKVFPETTYSVTIRYRKGVTTDLKIKYRDRWLNILGMLNLDEDDRWLVMSCSERPGADG